jgi:predicted nucleic acid-binding protein
MGKELKDYLLDTNILIYYWKGEIPLSEIKNLDEIIKRSLIISIITKIELLGWKSHTSDGFIRAKEFLGHAKVLPVDNDLADLTIELRRNNNIKLADALIAATALLKGLILVTRNEEDFAMIDDLMIYNPFK